MLWQRVLTAVVGIPLALLVVHLGGWWLGGLVLLVALLGLGEFYRLTSARFLNSYAWLGYPLGSVSVILPVLRPGHPTAWPIELPVLCLGLLALLVWALALFAKSSGGRLLATIAGVAYVGHLLSYLIRLRALEGAFLPLGRSGALLDFGEVALAGVLAVCWGMDTAAYAVGKTIGRHKLCPKLSPGKTIEGAVAGLLAAILLSAGLGVCLRLRLAHGIALGVLLGVAGQLGDLFESLLKRRAGVKDSGTLLPGHGGVLDRFDSLLFNGPAAFFYLRIALNL